MIRWSEHAAANLEDAYEYIVYSNGEEAADKIADLIVEAVERLATYPMLGRTGRIPGTRELVVAKTPFIVTYRIDKDSVLILAIYHGAQRWPTSL